MCVSMLAKEIKNKLRRINNCDVVRINNILYIHRDITFERIKSLHDLLSHPNKKQMKIFSNIAKGLLTNK